MTRIEVSGLTKYFKNECIFKNLEASFQVGESHAIVGPNGSGKTTLLKTLAGMIPPTSGTLVYTDDKRNSLDADEYYKSYCYVGPYLELIEEFTLIEFVRFHFQLKPISEGASLDDVLSEAYLEDSRQKPIKNFSSGMKLRLQLGLAFFANVPVVFFDEPTSNLDEQGVEWYQKCVKKYLTNRLLFVASNQLREYEMCENRLDLTDFK